VSSDTQDEIVIYDGTGVRLIVGTDAYRKDWLAINNNGQVVWEAFDGADYEIFIYDGTRVTQLTDNEHSDRKPHINTNGQVVWEADIGNSEIFLANPN
jgi:hypothetical protein